MPRGSSILLAALCCAATAAAAEGVSPDPTPRVVSYELDVGIFPDSRVDYAGFIAILFGQRPSWNKQDSLNAYPHLIGEAVLRIEMGSEPASSLKLYLHSELRLHEVRVNRERAEFSEETVLYPDNYSQVATAATVVLDPALSGEHTVEVKYGGMLNPSYSSSPSNYMRIDEEGAYLRSHGYSLWFPVLLGPGAPSHEADFRRVTIKTPKGFSAVLGGRRISQREADGFSYSEWAAEDWDLAKLQLTVRPFRLTRRQGLFLYHLDHPASERASEDILEMVQGLAAFYAKHYRAVETEDQLHIAELPNYASGISAGNMIGITSGQWRGFSSTDEDTSLEVLVAHELVHPYVQPPIEESSPLAALFIEGFPSYFHLPALEQSLGREWYLDLLRRKQESYLEKRETGETSWGAPLPEEKAILEISAGEIGVYKDVFILSDRVPLFLHFLRERAGPDRFIEMTRELMNTPDLTPTALTDLIERFLPGSRDDVRVWLETIEFPDRFRL